MTQTLPAFEQAFMFKPLNVSENATETATFFTMKRKKRFKTQLEWKNLKLDSNELKKYRRKKIRKKAPLKKNVQKLTSSNINDHVSSLSSINLNPTSSKSSTPHAPIIPDVDKKFFPELTSTPVKPDKKKRIRKKAPLKKNVQKFNDDMPHMPSLSSINLNATSSNSFTFRVPIKTDVDKKFFPELTSTTPGTNTLAKPDKKKKRVQRIAPKKTVEKLNSSNSYDDLSQSFSSISLNSNTPSIVIRVSKSNLRTTEGEKTFCVPTYQPKSFPTLENSSKVSFQPNEHVRRSKRISIPKRKFSEL